MRIKLLILAAAGLVFATANAREIVLIEGAYEAVLADVTLPFSVAGTITVRMCETCDAITLPVDPDTVYLGTSGETTLNDFRASVAEIRGTPTGDQDTLVGVFYSLETNRVTRVSLHTQ